MGKQLLQKNACALDNCFLYLDIKYTILKISDSAWYIQFKRTSHYGTTVNYIVLFSI